VEHIVTDLSPQVLLPEVILDAFFDEGAQFDPATLQEAFEFVGFEVIEQHIALSYGVSHIFSVFQRRRKVSSGE